MADESEAGLAAEKRPLTDAERALVRWLLEHEESGAERLLPQLDRLTVFQKCTCGCPTVYFALDDEPVTRKGERIISDYLGQTDGKLIGVMLLEVNDRISSIESYSLEGSDEPFGFPAIESLRRFEDVREINRSPEH